MRPNSLVSSLIDNRSVFFFSFGKFPRLFPVTLCVFFLLSLLTRGILAHQISGVAVFSSPPAPKSAPKRAKATLSPAPF